MLATVKITTIKVPDRIRIDMGDIDALSESLREKGQLQTILLHREADGTLELVAGGRRLLSAIRAGKTEVECLIREGWDRLTKKEAELEENLQRKSLTWQEEVKAKAELIRIREERKGGGLFGGPQVGKEVAEELGESESTLSRDTMLAKAMKQFPSLEQEENKTTAFKKYKQLMDQTVRAAVAAVESTCRPNLEIHHGDARTVLRTFPPESVHCIITDPPWGVDHQEMELTQKYTTTFDDSRPATLSLLAEVIPLLYRVLVPNSHLYLFFATKEYTEVRRLLEVCFKVEPVPLVWRKNRGQNLFPGEKFTPDYETIFFCKKGDRKLTRPSFAVFDYPVPEKKDHPNQKPVGLLQELVELSTVEHEVVLDPFAGSGTTLDAALLTGRKAIGVEKEKVYCDLIQTKGGCLDTKS